MQNNIYIYIYIWPLLLSCYFVCNEAALAAAAFVRNEAAIAAIYT